MDYTGLVFKYPIYRNLTTEEESSKLDPKQRLDVKLLDQICVIKMNSTYLESVDKYYAYKGFSSFITGGIFIMSITIILLISKTIFWDQWGSMSHDKSVSAFLAWLCTVVIFCPLAYITYRLLKKESFAYTHYPIRLNRRNRMMYVFRTDGTVLSVPWDEVFFTIAFGGSRIGNILGHVLNKETGRVQETFAFSAVTTGREILLGHWEFLRRYMEEGPQAVFDEVVYCMPIDGKYESFKVGMERYFALTAQLNPMLRLIAWPMNFLNCLGRFFAMRTSKIPFWPKEVEEACQVDPDDPWVKDSRINPPDLR